MACALGEVLYILTVLRGADVINVSVCVGGFNSFEQGVCAASAARIVVEAERCWMLLTIPTIVLVPRVRERGDCSARILGVLGGESIEELWSTATLGNTNVRGRSHLVGTRIEGLI